ncbi:unnamed protein product [Dracunculus medinensis]|uniref:Protein-L-isoaspartate O-methyltransferase n=1 Tax=Dracunculus medinensis TaxID=318479 RepID=A0A0N4UAZ9_DRAME|nr:unnamed protein product [Dracunculus medinensis]
MGLGASSCRDNDDLIDKLVEGKLVTSKSVELVDRSLFFPNDSKSFAYKDVAWKSVAGSPGHLHISAPCIYANVLEHLELEKGLSFLNVGSGTGYLNTVVGFFLGSNGLNHGIELHPNIVEFARARVFDFLIRPEVQCYDWAIPSYSSGNGLMLHPIYNCKYDRVYCGASVPESHRESLWDLLKVGGVLVMPFDDQVIMMLFALVVHFKYSFIFLLTRPNFISHLKRMLLFVL